MTTQATEPERRLMTGREVAEYFRVSPRTVSRWARTGQIPVARVTPGGVRRFWRDDVELVGQPGVEWPDVPETWEDAYAETREDLAPIRAAFAARVARDEVAR